MANAVEVAGPELGAVRIDSGDLGVLARQVRDQLDELGATNTRIVVSGDLDEFSIAGLRAEPVDIYGVGTSVVTGSGAPTASMVYKLVEVDGMPVEKRSTHKESHGGRKKATRLAKASGTIVEEIVHPAGESAPQSKLDARGLTVPLVREGDARRRFRYGRGPRQGGRRAAQPAVGRFEALPRRARDTDPDGPSHRPRRLGGATSEAAPVTELLATAVAALGGSERSGQVEMANAVAHAFDAGEHLAVQAGTGTGKSLAYLIPAIARAVATDEPVVVSTATIALQRQLVDRDLPALAESLAGALPREPKFALLKGRGNYLCLNKIHNGAAAEPEDGPQEELFDTAATTALGRDVQRLIAWSSTTETGDRDELTPGVPDRSWGQVSVSARECIGAARCPFGTDCFAEKARDTAGHADVVVTNHALLAIDAVSDAAVLPEHRLLVVDEAHELVDRVTGVATAELSNAVLSAANRRVARLVEPELVATAGGRNGDILIRDSRRDAGTHRPTRRRDDHISDRAA